MFNKCNIKKCGSTIDEDLNPKVKEKGSSPYSYNLWLNLG